MRTELVTTLKRKATELLSELSRDKEPILITQHGLPAAYLVEVESCENQKGKKKLGERANPKEEDKFKKKKHLIRFNLNSSKKKNTN